ncbi:acyl-ACP--UDP-N-acetylglucosamine O-acyltransferase [bacterium]|nr:acyl-ACP--UDP-N-acetylglucosamine O-acyltransferase [bacterium]
MSGIDKLAAVHPDARLGENVIVHPFAVIEAGAVIGDGSVIGPHAYITSHARLGKEVKISKGAVVGTDPQDLKFEGEESTLEVGDRTVIREFATLNRGTSHSGKTVVGSDCFLMAYSHVAHDCRVGDHVIIANSVNMAGHVEIDDWVIIGGMVPIHQFVRIGKHTFVGGGWRVPQDIPPYIWAAGEPMDYKGLNSVGLRRRGFSAEQLREIKNAYKVIYRSGLNFSQAVEQLQQIENPTDEVQEIIRFVASREARGMIGRSRGHESNE